MPILRPALYVVLDDDDFASADAHSVQRKAERQERDTRRANSRGASISSITLALQALQTRLAHETTKEQHFTLFGQEAQAEACREAIESLQQQIVGYQYQYYRMQQSEDTTQAVYMRMQHVYSAQPYTASPPAQQQHHSQPQQSTAISSSVACGAAQPVSFHLSPRAVNAMS